MTKEKSHGTAIGELGDETLHSAKQALTLCWSIDFLFCSWTEAIEKAESLDPQPGNLYEVCREFEVKHLRETVDRFWQQLSDVQELLTEKRQSRQIQRLYQTPQRFAENEYPSFSDAVLSLAQRLCGGLCIAVQGLTLDLEGDQDSSEFVLQADSLALKWQQTHQVLLTYKVNTKTLIALLDKELLQVENLVTDSAQKASSVVPKSEITVFTEIQMAIYKALDGRSLKLEELANQTTCGDTRRLYREGLKTVLMAKGYVKHQRGIGFYRPDSPPSELIAKQK